MSEYERLKAQSEAIKARQGLRWIVIAEEGQPQEDGYYLTTVGSVGIDPSETTCHELNWFKGQWYLPTDEMIPMEPVIAWRHKPKPYAPAPYLPCPICGGVEGCDHTIPERRQAFDLTEAL